MKTNIYTRKGDDGTTSLVGGKRVSKACDRVEAYGTVDELNSQLGLLLTYVSEPQTQERLLQCQRDLFSIGAILATEPDCPRPTKYCITQHDVEELEKAIDAISEKLPPWRGFVLPGGCRAAAVAHVCRTVCRRAERRILALGEENSVDSNVVAYINRLSDYLFVLSSLLNLLEGCEEKMR